MPSSRGSSQPRDRTQISHIAGRFFTVWATRQDQEYWSWYPIPSPGELSNPGIKLGCPASQADSLPAELPRKQKLGVVQRTRALELAWVKPQPHCWIPHPLQAHVLLAGLRRRHRRLLRVNEMRMLLMMKSHGNTFSYPFISQMKISEDQRNYHTTQQSASQEVVYGAGQSQASLRTFRCDEQKHKTIHVHEELCLPGRLAKSHYCQVYSKTRTVPTKEGLQRLMGNTRPCAVCSVAQLCPTLYDPVDCSPPGSSIHGILQARILEWVAISLSNTCLYWLQISLHLCLAASDHSLLVALRLGGRPTHHTARATEDTQTWRHFYLHVVPRTDQAVLDGSSWKEHRLMMER